MKDLAYLWLLYLELLLRFTQLLNGNTISTIFLYDGRNLLLNNPILIGKFKILVLRKALENCSNHLLLQMTILRPEVTRLVWGVLSHRKKLFLFLPVLVIVVTICHCENFIRFSLIIAHPRTSSIWFSLSHSKPNANLHDLAGHGGQVSWRSYCSLNPG